MLRILYLMNILIFSSTVWAARIVDVPPLKTSSHHAGKMAGIAPCAPANSYLTNLADVPVNPVTGIRHVFYFNFHDVGGVNDQTVTIKIRKNSFVNSAHSNAGADPGGNTQGPILTFDADWESPELTVPKNGIAQAEIWFVCTSVQCKVDFTDLTSSVRAKGDAFDCNFGPGQSCMRAVSFVAFQVKVKEPEGAVTATVNTVPHRCNGWLDTIRSSVSTTPICAGKPF